MHPDPAPFRTRGYLSGRNRNKAAKVRVFLQIVVSVQWKAMRRISTQGVSVGKWAQIVVTDSDCGVLVKNNQRPNNHPAMKS
jgi:hypothetical protein